MVSVLRVKISHDEQPLVFRLVVGHQIPRRAAIQKSFILKKPAKRALRHAELLRRGSDIGAVIRIHERVKKISFRLKLRDPFVELVRTVLFGEHPLTDKADKFRVLLKLPEH